MGEALRAPGGADDLHRYVPLCALVVAVVAAVLDPSSPGGYALAAVPVAVFALWAYRPGIPLLVVTLAVVVAVVAAQRTGELEPLMFDVSILACVIGLWSASLAVAVGLGLVAAAAPVAVGLVQNPSEIRVGIWIVGIVLPWLITRAWA